MFFLHIFFSFPRLVEYMYECMDQREKGQGILILLIEDMLLNVILNIFPISLI